MLVRLAQFTDRRGRTVLIASVVVFALAGDEDTVDARIESPSPAFTRQTGVLDVRVGGQAEVFRQIGSTMESDLAKAESLAIPITLLLLVASSAASSRPGCRWASACSRSSPPSWCCG